MCKIPLFLSTVKRNWTLLLIFFLVLTMYMGVIIAMYDPQDMEAITAMLDLFPEEMMKAMGFSQLVHDLTGYLASWLYGFLMLAFPMVYCIILGNRLVVQMVDNSSFSYLLSSPTSRVAIIFTQGLYALVSLVVLFGALFGIGVLFCTLAFPDLLDIGAFFQLNVCTLLVQMVVMMICFFFSCLCNDTKHYTLYGAGIPILSLLMNMLGENSSTILKTFSFHGLYKPIEVVVHGIPLLAAVIYGALIVVLFLASIIVFDRKQLFL